MEVKNLNHSSLTVFIVVVVVVNVVVVKTFSYSGGSIKGVWSFSWTNLYLPVFILVLIIELKILLVPWYTIVYQPHDYFLDLRGFLFPFRTFKLLSFFITECK